MLKLVNINKTFNEKNIFSDLNLTIGENDFITIIGSNGAGKSTLLNIVSGEVEVDKGEIILKGKPFTYLAPYKKAKLISRVYQNPALGTSPSLNIIENLSMAINKNKGMGFNYVVRRHRLKYFEEILRPLNIGLEKELSTVVNCLSGGQRQALALIMATITKPEMLLLDEHTAALDPSSARTILNLTEELASKNKIPTLMVTHNMDDALRYGNRLIMLDRGNVVLDINGEEKSKLTNEKLRRKFSEIKGEISDRMLFS